MFARHLTLPVVFGIFLGGCGTMVPLLRDFPNNGTEAENNQLVLAIVKSVHCELKDAVTSTINDDLATAKINGFRYADFLNQWGAQVALTLLVEEKTSINPNAVWLPLSSPASIFTLGAGLTGTADATRIEKMNYYYTVKELYMGKNKLCIRDANPPSDSFLIQSDLKLREWLHAQVGTFATRQLTIAGTSAGPFKQNVLSHQVTFQVTTAGNITPAWKLTRATVNQSGSFLSATRDRKHDLLITFGPLDKSQSGSFLIPVAENTHISSQLTSGITTGFKNAISP